MPGDALPDENALTKVQLEALSDAELCAWLDRRLTERGGTANITLGKGGNLTLQMVWAVNEMDRRWGLSAALKGAARVSTEKI